MNILVTGSSRGIGKVIAQELSSLGNVFVTGRNEELLKNSNCKYYVCDLSKDTDKLCEFIKENNIGILINNAGEYIYGAIEEMSSEQIESICATNLIAPIKLINACVPYMKSQKFGRIVNIGSISGVMGEAYASLYSSTKSGLIGLTKALALELAEHNITINTINPGWVDTELGSRSIEESEFTKEEILETIPQRRFVEPIEVANLVKYLISNEAKGVTGQSINLCAGLSVGI
ncbi:SDR family oxidoreductase [bacterium]|nr:SDR family oxidoreductase [bacterium]